MIGHNPKEKQAKVKRVSAKIYRLKESRQLKEDPNVRSVRFIGSKHPGSAKTTNHSQLFWS
jgi:hypothetical protein